MNDAPEETKNGHSKPSSKLSSPLSLDLPPQADRKGSLRMHLKPENSDDYDNVSHYSDDFEEVDVDADAGGPRYSSRARISGGTSSPSRISRPVTFAEDLREKVLIPEDMRENTSENVELPWLSPPPSRRLSQCGTPYGAPTRSELASACPSEHVEGFYGDDGYVSRPYSVGSPVRPTSEEGYVNLSALGLQAMPSQPQTPQSPQRPKPRDEQDELFDEDVYEKNQQPLPQLDHQIPPQDGAESPPPVERQSSLPNIHHTELPTTSDAEVLRTASVQLPFFPGPSESPRELGGAGFNDTALPLPPRLTHSPAPTTHDSSHRRGSDPREKLSLSYNSGTAMLQSAMPYPEKPPNLAGSFLGMPVPRPAQARARQSAARPGVEKLPRGSRPPSSRKNKGTGPPPPAERKPQLEKAIIADSCDQPNPF